MRCGASAGISCRCFCSGAAHHATRALALRACVLRAGLLRYGDALAIRLSGEAVQSLTFTGPVLAQPTNAWLLEGHGLSLKEGFAATRGQYRTARFANHLRHVENTKSCG
jgi:hypothetical protein